MPQGLPLIRATNVNLGRIADEGMMYVDPADVPASRDAILCAGDIIIVRSGAYTGDSAIIPQQYAGAIAGYDMVVRSSRDHSPYLGWQFLSAEVQDYQFQLVKLRAAQPHLNAEELGETLLCIPPLLEQRAIAAFLDRETDRIDRSIDHKERLIALLEEKRQALISQAVTRGLDPSVPLRDSRIPWLGMVPKNWTIGRIKNRLTKVEQGWSPQCDKRTVEPGEWGVLKVGCMNSGIFDESECKALPPELAPLPEFEIRVGDILMSRSNTVELVGMTGIVHKTQGRILLCDKLYRLGIRRDRLDPEFAVFLLRSSASRSQIEPAASGASSSMRNISAAIVRDLIFAFPPLAEQSAIAARLKALWGRIDNSQMRIRDGISRLQEYRTALISAAVTGQIDVRDEV
jgi:type I restriction enzyme S subunit